GAHEPLAAEELRAKYRANAAAGNVPDAVADALEAWCGAAFDAPDMAGLAAFRIEP
ncbi:MAG: MmgE/PrpD family protein, partial [Proteobacteria bacterium]|nr:MmgE/PrpD family protein [Pseudomonadota bacterium]